MTEREWVDCAEPGLMMPFLEGKASDRKLRLLACAAVRRIWHLLTSPASRTAVEMAERFADGLVSAETRRKAFRAVMDAVDGVPTFEGFMIFGGTQQDIAAALTVMDGSEYLFSAFTGKYLDAKPPYNSWLPIASAVCEHVPIAAGNHPRQQSLAPHRKWHDILRSAIRPIVNLVLNRSAYDSAFAEAHAMESQSQADLVHDVFGLLPFRPLPIDSSWLTPTVVSLAQAIYDERTFDRLPILGDALEDASCANADLLMHLRNPGVHVRGSWALDSVLRKE